jgi:cytochrome c553
MYGNFKEHLENTLNEIREAGLYKNERVIEGVVRNVYKNDVGKLAAWTSASHVEKAPKKSTPSTP